MAITTISSREFNQDTSGAKNAARNGPVIITDRGRPAHVLLTIEEYRRIAGGGRKIADLLAMPGIDEVEMEIPRWDELPRPADLS
ncbi:type II toxin-antitoxin system Phd/YefM family antitoxin [Candidatus Thiodictyon syntrophicum]|jgi:prevent-host-death family protein|uniref:Antitoxin n=1 Tax=Candidatus Thiodictyon syntrophicum TaxID=1166950 RepID=A0A2K8U384_9GAMM|nr:type II toxin-antitoxin system Phd/YefM family antitoxin [Candidatus Thiodictyon syntrophicum]AUB80007.1 prevent-host-death protein [Candidatus Thiodictyon syntrophicum]